MKRSGVSHVDADGLETVPAWDCVEGCPVAELDRQSGERKGDVPGRKPRLKAAEKFGWSGPANGDHETAGFADSGGASRFFPTFSWTDADLAPFLYCPKASRRERNAGLEGMPQKRNDFQRASSGLARSNGDKDGERRTQSAGQANFHPTVKPLALMRWLCLLVTPPGGAILDPFAGSFTTGLAAAAEGFDAILFEQDPEYFELGRRRLASVPPRIPLAEVSS